MSVELRPLGVRCNLQCRYCYQNPQREVANVSRAYDLDAMKAAIEAEGGPFSIFGGEPLLLPREDLEELLAWGFQRYGSNSVQTNGVLIDERHLEIFRRYNVRVGISIDGPEDLNEARWMGSQKKTQEATRKIESNIRLLIENAIRVGVIVTLHRDNASPERLPRLLDWTRSLASLGVSLIRLHLLESESAIIRNRFALTDEENIAALMAFHELAAETEHVQFDLFTDIRRLLLGDDSKITCVWNACDPMTTPAVCGVEGDGQRSNCDRTNKEGINFVTAERGGLERYDISVSHPD